MVAGVIDLHLRGTGLLNFSYCSGFILSGAVTGGSTAIVSFLGGL